MTPVVPPANESPDAKLKIYFLPNLLTAGNLFCGFVALTKIVEAEVDKANFYQQITLALGFILLACIFDLFDGRVARMGGVESPFGREFDSLADLISFGVAPAFLVHRVVLRDVFPAAHPEWGWFVASIYLICGAFRLARFNCLAANGGGGGREFLGFPIPSAAGLVSSLTLLIIQLNENDRTLGKWKWLLVAVLLFLSAMMVSTVKYPSFKSLGLRSSSTFTKAIIAALFLGFILVLREKILYYVLPALFTVYLLYGFVRPRISGKMRREIEEEDDDYPGAVLTALMLDTHPILLAGLTGFVSGFLLSIPVGPINLTIINEGARRGFYWAMMIGLGATTMEVIYCFIAFTGFASFFSKGVVKAGMELFSFVFMLFLGVKFLLTKSVNQPPVDLGRTAEKFGAEIEQRLKPHSAFMTGLVRVMANIGVLAFWIVFAANFISREWVSPDWPGKLACVTGVALGTGSWFVGLSWMVSLGHGKFSEKTLLRMEHLSGVGLLVLALIHGGIIISQMARHHRRAEQQTTRATSFASTSTGGSSCGTLAWTKKHAELAPRSIATQR